jgi:hypothetical protein
MLSRETQKQLWQDLLARSSATPDRRSTPFIVWPLTMLLTFLAMYLFTKL